MKWTRLLIVLMGWAHLAQAAPDALSPDARASAAREMRGEGRYPEAVATIEAGLAEAPAHTELRLLHALTLIDMRRYEAALVACRAYLKVARPGPNRRQMGQQCRDLSQVEGTVLTVEVAPGPADVYLGYEALGIACVAAPRCDKGLLPGRYTIIVKRPGYAPWRERIRMRRGQRRALAVELEELPSELTITVRPLVPAGAAEVVVDGRVLGPEQDSLEVAAGEHELRVAAPGYFVHTQIISAHEGRPLAVEVALDERVLVEASPPHAVFELDGQPVELEPVAAAEPGEATPAAATTDAGSGPALGVDEPGASNSTVAAEDAEPSPPRPAASVRSLRLPGDRRAHTLTARAPGYLDRTVGLALDRPVEYSLTLALEPVPAPPPPDAAPERCRWCQPVAATAAATATLAGLGAAGYYTWDVRRASGRVDAECDLDGAGARRCSDAGVAASERVSASAGRANLAFAGGVVASLGGLWAWNLDDRAPATGLSRRRWLSLGVAGGVAAGGLAVGAWYGRRARARLDASRAWCEDGACTPAGVVLVEQAGTDSRAANLGFAVAGVAVANAALLWLTAPGPSDDDDDDDDRSSEIERRAATDWSLRLTPMSTAGGAGLILQGDFE